MDTYRFSLRVAAISTHTPEIAGKLAFAHTPCVEKSTPPDRPPPPPPLSTEGRAAHEGYLTSYHQSSCFCRLL